jgi:hypothetical protein
MFKRMKPKEFVVGRKYRTNREYYSEYIYTCMPKYGSSNALVRSGRGWIEPDNSWEWEEVTDKKKKFV